MLEKNAGVNASAHRNVTKFCKGLGMTLTDTHKRQKLTEAQKNVSRVLVLNKWHKRYTDEYEETKHKKE